MSSNRLLRYLWSSDQRWQERPTLGTEMMLEGFYWAGLNGFVWSSAFQSGMVRGRKLYLNASTAGWKHWNCKQCPLFEGCYRGTGWYLNGTSTKPFVILYIIVSRLWRRRVWRDSQPRSLISAVTETGGLCWNRGAFIANRAALCWTISTLSIYFWWCGSQMDEQYSNFGRIIAL